MLAVFASELNAEDPLSGLAVDERPEPRRDVRDALRAGLLRDAAVGEGGVGFALAEAQADDGRKVLIYGVSGGGEGIRAVDVDDFGVGRALR